MPVTQQKKIRPSSLIKNAIKSALPSLFPQQQSIITDKKTSMRRVHIGSRTVKVPAEAYKLVCTVLAGQPLEPTRIQQQHSAIRLRMMTTLKYSIEQAIQVSRDCFDIYTHDRETDKNHLACVEARAQEHLGEIVHNVKQHDISNLTTAQYTIVWASIYQLPLVAISALAYAVDVPATLLSAIIFLSVMRSSFKLLRAHL